MPALLTLTDRSAADNGHLPLLLLGCHCVHALSAFRMGVPRQYDPIALVPSAFAMKSEESRQESSHSESDPEAVGSSRASTWTQAM